ncbi:Cell wall-associated hydrolase, NlpC family [Paramicrobacterium humi]|uniref:Cell wall-associated hydrolase, NlpC family n=1 Tax=Paramicrobacterium humi TaxID=640635 RepID=A0A1H4N5P8_9MICO|nr:C40 family peptidase [Microbacterium humi]SEB90065.1 Cell wall-associated hydrolase, NlpC family [Microbacterium humi]
MTMAVALQRITDIEAQLQQLTTGIQATDAATSGTSAATSASFANALDAALGATGQSGAVTGNDIVEGAKKYLGVPYVFGGEDANGMDCSGLVQRVLADLGIDAPRVVQDQADIGVEVPSLDQAQPGDLLVVKGEGHIVIYAGDGKIIHAPRPGKNVQLVDNYLKPSDISTIRRVVPSASAASASASVAGTAGVDGSLLSTLGLGGAGTTAGASPSQLLALMRSGFSQAVGS